MGLQKEETELVFKINSVQAKATVKEMTDQIKMLTNGLVKMHEADNPSLYASRVRQLNYLKEAREAELKVINGSREALKKYQEDFVKSIKAMDAAASNNPVKKLQQGVSESFDQIKKKVANNPLTDFFAQLKTQAPGADTPGYFSVFVNGFASISSSVKAYREELLQSQAIIEANKDLQTTLATATAENTVAQELNNGAIAANTVQQEVQKAAVLEAVTIEEAQAASTAYSATVKEASVLATKAQTLAEEEQVLALETETAAQIGANLATEGGISGMNRLKIAFATSGIGFLIIALGSLVAYFESTNEGSRKLKAGMASVNAVIQESLKLLGSMGKVVYDLFTGNFKQLGADVDVVKKNLSGFTENAGKAAKAGKDLVEQRFSLTKAEREWSSEKIKQQTIIGDLTKKFRDQNISEAQRIENGKKAKALIIEMSNRDLAYAKQNEALINKEQALNSKKDYQAITDAKNRTLEILKSRTNMLDTIDNKESALENKGRKRDARADAKGEKQAETERQKLLKEFESLSAEYKALGVKELDSQLSKNEKEIAQEEEKYNKLIAKEQKYLQRKNLSPAERKGTEQQIDGLEVQKGEAVKNIRIRQEQDLMDKIKQLRAGFAAVQETEYQKQVDQINKFYDEQQKAAGTNQEQLAAIALGRQQDLSTAEITEKKRLEDEKQKLEDEGNVLSDDKNDNRIAKINASYDKEIADLKAKFSKEIQATQAFQDAIDVINGNRDKDIKKSDDDEAEKKKKALAEKVQQASDKTFAALSVARKAETNAKISELEKQRNAELNNANLTQSQKKLINDKYTKLENDEKLRAWKADQRAALAQAVINGALAVIKALPNVFLASIAGAAAAIQIGVIATEKPPTYAKGGMIPTGPSHDEGGINLINNKTGETIAEMEGGEYVEVLSKDTVRNNRSHIDNKLLFNSMYRNGASVNTAGINNGIQLARFGALVSTSASGVTPSSAGNQTTTAAHPDYTAMLALMERMVAAQKEANQQPLIFSNRLYQKQNTKMINFLNDINA